jgi:hypothetical protein
MAMLKFSSENLPEGTFLRAVKKPIPIRCIQMDAPFVVKTMEGELNGKEGDWLMIGIQGEVYPCDNEIFIKTYDLLPES